AWPNLTRLELLLYSSTKIQHPFRLTLRGLRAFAKHCKNLVSLSICVDASAVPPSDNSLESRISQSSLTSFDISTSPINDPPTVAQFLSALYASLKQI
ncbi:hypothetical protein DFH07DRAFT_693756, partial [Mycena maculata]